MTSYSKSALVKVIMRRMRRPGSEVARLEELAAWDVFRETFGGRGYLWLDFKPIWRQAARKVAQPFRKNMKRKLMRGRAAGKNEVTRRRG